MTNNNDTSRRHATLTAAAVASLLLLTACTGHKKDATQSAARVDGTEITVHQINYRLQRERGLRPEQQDAASRRILEQLIDEQLLVEKAEKVKMDLEPRARQALDAARREVLARAYVEQAVQTVPPPTDSAVRAYFESNDALFAHRRIYTLKEYLGRVPPAAIPALRALVESGKSPGDVEAWFKAQGASFRAQESTQAAERIPLDSLKTLAAVQDGHGLVASAGDQVHVTYVVSSTEAPVTFDQAKPAIVQFLSVGARRKVNESNLAALSTAAKIEYSAPYQTLAASGPALATIKDVETTTPLQVQSGTHVSLPLAGESSGVQVNLPTTSASSIQVTLPANQQGVRVSLPTIPASSVEVRLPPQNGGDAKK